MHLTCIKTTLMCCSVDLKLARGRNYPKGLGITSCGCKLSNQNKNGDLCSKVTSNKGFQEVKSTVFSNHFEMENKWTSVWVQSYCIMVTWHTSSSKAFQKQLRGQVKPNAYFKVPLNAL